VIKHLGGVNRIRAQALPNLALPPSSQPYYTGIWAETGKANIYDIRPSLKRLDTQGHRMNAVHSNYTPAFTVESHSTEGFAMD